MKEYTSCFIGIPLPDKFQQYFEELLNEVPDISPLLKTVDPKTPHITIFYLDKQSQFILPKIAEAVEPEVGLLKKVTLTVGGFDYFRGKTPRVMFLDIKYPPSLKDFNQAITPGLTQYYAEENALPFHPHMTVGGLWTPEAQQTFSEIRPKLERRFNQINWTFPITEVVLYGADSTRQPEFQEKLIHIPV